MTKINPTTYQSNDVSFFLLNMDMWGPTALSMPCVSSKQRWTTPVSSHLSMEHFECTKASQTGGVSGEATPALQTDRTTFRTVSCQTTALDLKGYPVCLVSPGAELHSCYVLWCVTPASFHKTNHTFSFSIRYSLLTGVSSPPAGSWHKARYDVDVCWRTFY